MNAVKFAVVLSAASLAATLTAGAHASVTTLSEDFENFAGLTASDWVLTNNSVPAGQPWFAGNSGIFSAQAGTPGSYAAANFLSADNGAGTIDNWLISAEFSLLGGATLDFYTRGADNGYFDKLEVRFGSGTSSNVANFTTLLATIGDGVATKYPTGWTEYTLSLPTAVTGRVAFRYLGDASMADYIGIDSVVVTALAVPEPGSLALVAAAFAAAASARRRPTTSSSKPLV